MAKKNSYTYFINLNERGIFSADVRNFKGETIFDINNQNDTEENSEDGTLWIVESGYMDNPEDVDGLLNYLIDMGIIDSESTLKLDDGQEEETRCCIDVLDMQKGIHNIYVMSDNDDSEELQSLFLQLENWKDELEAQFLWEQIDDLIEETFEEVLPAQIKGDKVWINHKLESVVTFETNDEIFDVVGSYRIYQEKIS